MPWFGRVWLNPPYGRESRVWMERMVVHGHGTALIPVATGTRLWQEVVFPHATAILFYRHRVTFIHPKGDSGGMVSPAASALIAFGNRDATALRDSGLPGYFLPVAYDEEPRDTPV
ncbi:DNA N-6-adenine-methyltransferase (Dam) [Microbacterium sp. XT11]|nr:DNA N-6-adenine-methyltransferase (Dam) [Microbacterium sp. XT11]